MTSRIAVVLALAALPAHAVGWEETLASTASLRSGGARLVASDAIAHDGRQTALITYWETASGTPNADVYRCVDIVGSDYAPLRQACWKVTVPKRDRPR